MLSRMSPFRHVAELVRDHALQLVAGQVVQAALGHAHRRVGRRVAGGERVDAGLVGHQVDVRYRHAGGDRDLLDHVAQAAQLRVSGIRRHRCRAHTLGDALATVGQAHDAEQRTEPDPGQHDHAGGTAAGTDSTPPARRPAGWWPMANHTTASIAATMAITASTNSTTSRRLLPRTRACCAKKSMEAPANDQRHRGQGRSAARIS